MNPLTITSRRALLAGRPATSRRHLTTTTASEAADQLMQTFHNKTTTRRQVLDSNQLQRLSLTLNRPHLHPSLDVSDAAPPAGTPLPPGYHLAYFTPAGVEAELGLDGTDKTFNAPAPFTRRMWAGGRMKWTPGVRMRVGEEVEERTRLVGAVAKKGRTGGDMVLVDVEKQFLIGGQELALVDERSWIFRTEIPAAVDDLEVLVQNKVVRGPSYFKDLEGEGKAYPPREHRWSPVGLFRFSALTFNGHKIHYDNAWSVGIENHKGLVVHGPINLISMLDYWRDVCGGGKEVREISYRATSPLYAGDVYRVQAAAAEGQGEGQSWAVTVEKDGKPCMTGSIVQG